MNRLTKAHKPAVSNNDASKNDVFKTNPSKTMTSLPSRAALTLASMMLLFSAHLFASTPLMQADHGNKAIDLSEPIGSIQNLSSLNDADDDTLSFTLPEFQHFTTENGVPVMFIETPEQSIVDVAISFDAGSARDTSIRPDSFGLADVVSSVLTQGTSTLDETEFAKTTETLSIDINSVATKDKLIVMLRGLAGKERLIPAANLTGQVISAPRLHPEVLKRVKAQRMLGFKRLQITPAYLADRRFEQLLYGDHPYAHPYMGTKQSIEDIRIEDLQQFVDRYFVANNATLSITGDLSLADAKAVAHSITRQLPMGNKAAKLPVPSTPKTAKRIDLNFDSDQTTVIIGQLGDALSRDEAGNLTHAEFDIAHQVLVGSGLNSRLMQKLREETGYVYGVYGNMTRMDVSGNYSIQFSTRNETAQETIDLALATIDDFVKNGITEEEFNLTKESLINRYPMGFTSNASINFMLNSINSYGLPDSYVTGYMDRIKSTKLDAVNQTIKDTIDPDKLVIVTIGDIYASGMAKDKTNVVSDEHKKDDKKSLTP